LREESNIAIRIYGLLHRATKANRSIPIQYVDVQHIGIRRTHASEFPRQVHHDAGKLIVEGPPPSYSVISSKFVRNTIAVRACCQNWSGTIDSRRCGPKPPRLCHLCRPEVHHDGPPSH
jgi:hypothetical protein